MKVSQRKLVHGGLGRIICCLGKGIKVLASYWNESLQEAHCAACCAPESWSSLLGAHSLQTSVCPAITVLAVCVLFLLLFSL